MMQYIKLDTYEQAELRSRQVFDVRRGRAKPPPDVTIYQWGIMQHPTISYVLMTIDEGTEHMLSAGETNRLLSRTHPHVQAMLVAISPPRSP